MKVKEIMTPMVETIRPGASLTQAAHKMSELNIGSLLIVEEDQLLGIITDRDIACFAVAMGHDANSTEVQMVMNREITTCFGDTEIEKAAQLMEHNHIRRLPVLQADNTMAGFLSVDDIARYSHHLAGEVLQSATPTH